MRTAPTLIVAVILAVTTLFDVWEVAAKPSHCAKDCKQDIKNCLALVPTNKACTGTKAEKKACRKMHAAQRKTCRSLTKLCKHQNPSISGTCLLAIMTPTTTTTTTTTTSTTTIASPACRFPATGQTTCWDSNGTVIPCTGTGQDGDLKKGAPLSYTDNGDGTITDNNTSLVWEKLSMDGSVHDVGNGYTWDQAFSVHVATLNSASFAGHNDWRLPNVRELGSIVNFQDAHLSVSPAFNTGCTAGCTPTTCSCTAADAYWSSTPDWGVNFSVGQGGTPTVGGGGVFARAVRGGSSCLPATGETTCADSNGNMIPCAGTGQDGDLKKGAPLSYTDNGDGTITDNNTSLVWEKLSMDGSVHDVSNGYTWDQAFSGHVATLNSVSFAGHNDWRLPNVRELESINDYDRINFENTGLFVSPAFNTGCTAGCTPTSCSCTAADPFSESFFYWSSTTYARNPSHAYDVSARVAPDPKNFETFAVRAVRGGS